MVSEISFFNLALALVPMGVAMLILVRERVDYKHSLYAFARMILQLIGIGYVLRSIFSTDSSIVVVGILIAMLVVSSSISLRSVKKTPTMFAFVVLALVLGAGLNLVFMTRVILEVRPWYNPSSIIPLGGMQFFNALNAISIAMDRFQGEVSKGTLAREAERTALKTCIIPITNSFLAAGIVSLPGFMTGQILSGVSPLVAVRYQIVILTTIFSSQIISTFIFLRLFCVYKRRRGEL